MQELFADEIKAWKAAQASGQTLTDHVVSASVVEMTTPVSENEISFLDDDEEEEESQQAPTQGVITAASARPSASQPPLNVTPSVLVAPTAAQQLAQAPTVTTAPPIDLAAIPAAPMPQSPSGPMRQHVPTPAHPMAMQPMQHVSSGPIRMITDSNPVVGASSYPREPTAFPIAPREWRDHKSPTAADPNERQRKNLIVGGLIAIAVVAIIALVTGGASSPVAATVEVAPEPVEKTPVIDMRVEPPPAPVVETKPAPPTEPAPPATDTAPPATTEPAVAPKSMPKTTPAPATRTPKPEEHRHHATTPAPKTDPKADPKKVDPNSGLPPP
jgi:hypothetical protein